MSNNPATSFFFSIAPLPRKDYTDQQEFANAIAAALIGNQIVTPVAVEGKPGKDGTVTTITTREVAIEADAEYVDTGIDLSTVVSVRLINTGPSSETPTLSLAASRGNLQFFTEAAPTGNYKLQIVSIAVSTPS